MQVGKSPMISMAEIEMGTLLVNGLPSLCNVTSCWDLLDLPARGDNLMSALALTGLTMRILS